MGTSFLSSPRSCADTVIVTEYTDHPDTIMDEMIEQVAPTNVSLDDLEELINSLSPDEVAELAECDPDASSMPAYMRCAYRCDKEATVWKGDESREALAKGLKDQALAEPDKDEVLKWEKGVIRG